MPAHHPSTFVRGIDLQAILVCCVAIAGCSFAEADPALDAEKPTTAPSGGNMGDFATPNRFDVEEAPAATPQSSPSASHSLTASSLAEYLAVNPDFYYELVDDLFYAQHRHLNRRPLTQVNTPMEASLRQAWWQTAAVAAAKLKQIDTSVQQQLGSYRLQDYQQTIRTASALGVTEITFREAIATRFQQLFPALAGYENGEDTSGFQLWCAIAQEELQKIQEGQSFEQAER